MKPKLRGRRKPYSYQGIHRVPCARCGKPSRYQWQCCSNRNRWLGVCRDCDIKLNAWVLRFFKFTNWRSMIAAYIKRID